MDGKGGDMLILDLDDVCRALAVLDDEITAEWLGWVSCARPPSDSSRTLPRWSARSQSCGPMRPRGVGLR